MEIKTAKAGFLGAEYLFLKILIIHTFSQDNQPTRSLIARNLFLRYFCSMCGLIGQISRKHPVNVSAFQTMRDTLVHRGPDDAASHYFEGGYIALGHRRLSFLDLSTAGRQPLSNETENVWVVFNGEI